MIITDTGITLAGDISKGVRNNMVEFGEQLRKAREEKGMTQQTLAEQLFVTRQAVSKWECGERYPDLPTTKKISEALDVSLDDLLSGKDMNKVVERNSIIDNNLAEKLILVIYAIFLSQCLRLIYSDFFSPHIMFQSDSEFWHFNTSSLVQNITWNIIPKILFSVLILILIYGFIRAAKGTLSPRIIGIIGIATFVASSIMHVTQIITLNLMQLVISNLTVYNYAPKILDIILPKNFLILPLILLPAAIGAVSTYFYFICRSNKNIWSIVFSIMAISEMMISIKFIFNWNQTDSKLHPYLAFTYFQNLDSLGNMHLYRYGFYIAVYVFLLFQAVALWIKKTNAKNTTEANTTHNVDVTEASNIKSSKA